MDCIAPCPTGSIDNWRVVEKPYALAEQLAWSELPAQEERSNGAAADGTAVEALTMRSSRAAGRSPQGHAWPRKGAGLGFEAVRQSLHAGQARRSDRAGQLPPDCAGCRFRRPPHYPRSRRARFPVLEGQSIGIIPPGTDANGKPHLPRLYSVSSPRDGERPNTNNLSLTVKRDPKGVCSNYVCDLEKGDKVKLTGPFGATFLMPDDPRPSSSWSAPAPARRPSAPSPCAASGRFRAPPAR